jgi:hypothetical protein
LRSLDEHLFPYNIKSASQVQAFSLLSEGLSPGKIAITRIWWLITIHRKSGFWGHKYCSIPIFSEKYCFLMLISYFSKKKP